MTGGGKIDRLPDDPDGDGPPVIRLPGLDAALIGVVWQSGQAVAVYHRPSVIAFFMAHGMTEEAAAEWVTFNVEGAWPGTGTPALVGGWEPDSIE